MGLRAALGLGAVLAVPALLWADTAVAFLRGWRPPPWRLLPAVSLLPLAGLAAATLLAAAVSLSRSGRRFYRSHAPDLLVATAALAGSALAAEALARHRFDAWTAFHRRPPNLHVVFRARPGLFPGTEGDAHYRTNALGIRGPDLPRSRSGRRILCVGGSSTECVYLDDAEAWPRLLMETLSPAGAPPVWAGGVGISGFTTAEHLLFVRHSALMDQVDDAVFLVGFNDAGRVLIGAAETGPAPAWRRSALFQLGLQAVRRTAEHRLIDQIDAFGENIRRKRLRRRSAARTESLPEFGLALRDYGARLRAIARACRARGVRPVFVTHPVLYDGALSREARELLWLGEAPDGAFVTARRLRQVMDSYNAVLLEVCRESRVACLDLGALNGRADLFLDDCHFNEAGAREVARRLAPLFQAGRSPTSGSP